MTLDRVDHLWQKIQGQADALLITSPANVAYLSGFTGEGILLLSSGGEWRLITD